MTVAELVSGIFGPVGALFALALAILAFVKGWVVPGWLYAQTKVELKNEVACREDAERKAWRMATGLAEPAIKTTERLVSEKFNDAGSGTYDG